MIPKTSRIESIDVLRGVAMVIMALDHVRDYFHYGSTQLLSSLEAELKEKQKIRQKSLPLKHPLYYLL